MYDPRKLIGVTSLDVMRANTWVAEMMGCNPREVNVVVAGGHAGVSVSEFQLCSLRTMRVIPVMAQTFVQLSASDRHDLTDTRGMELIDDYYV